jgi:hypothetical protein
MGTTNDLIDGVKRRQQEIATSLVDGNCVNFETYQRLVGQYQGLQEALQILDNIMKEDDQDVERH